MGRELYRQRKYHEAMQWLDVARVNYTSSPHGVLLGAKAERIFEIQSQVLAEQRKESKLRKGVGLGQGGLMQVNC